MMRAVIYARYSSDLQSEASIEDQVRLCQLRANTEGWSIQKVYSDRALSGSNKFRPRYMELLDNIRAHQFDVLIAEALDRLSRDQEDIAALYKALSFAGIRLITLAEGEINELHVGLKGTMNALFLKDLAAKTHRGLRGRVEQGRSAGGKAYGYEMVREVNSAGERIRGLRTINEEEARVVRHIFERFVGGASPTAIARQLNADGVPGPNGKAWQDTTIRGHAGRKTGILRNELYIGRAIWNRQRFLKDPKNGKRVARPNPESEWVIEETPELRIIDDALWHRVAERLDDIGNSPTARALKSSRFWEHRRAKHLLTGLAFCGHCGSKLTPVGKDYLRCTSAHRNDGCTHGKSIKRGTLEDLVIEALQNNLMQPDLVDEFIAAFNEEISKNTSHGAAERKQSQKRLSEINRQLEGLITAIAEGLRSSTLQHKLDTLEQERHALEAKLSAPQSAPVLLHPNLAELYRRKVETLHNALRDEASGPEALEIMRSLIAQVDVTYSKEDGFTIELIGEIAAMVMAAQSEADPQRKNAAPERTAFDERTISSVKLVAGAGFEPTTFRL